MHAGFLNNLSPHQQSVTHLKFVCLKYLEVFRKNIYVPGTCVGTVALDGDCKTIIVRINIVTLLITLGEVGTGSNMDEGK